MLSHSPFPFGFGGQVHTSKVEPLDWALQKRKEKPTEEILSSQTFPSFGMR